MNVSIIGHAGRMGQLFSHRLCEAGCSVTGVDKPLLPHVLEKSMYAADIIMLCVPVEAMDDVLALMKPFFKPHHILMDITSVKVLPMQMMEKVHTGAVVGTHPLFGPQPTPKAMPVAVTPSALASEEAIQQVERICTLIGGAPFRTTAEEHDRAAARIQGLNFVSSVVYLATLAHDEQLLPYITPSFRRRLDAAQKMLTEDGAIFEGMFEANPYSQDAVRSFRTFLAFAAAGDVDVLLDRALWWWREDTTPLS